MHCKNIMRHWWDLIILISSIKTQSKFLKKTVRDTLKESKQPKLYAHPHFFIAEVIYSTTGLPTKLDKPTTSYFSIPILNNLEIMICITLDILHI
jgi:hypothetical protein